MEPVVEVKNITMIFGKSPKVAVELLKKGSSKQDILKKTEQNV